MKTRFLVPTASTATLLGLSTLAHAPVCEVASHECDDDAPVLVTTRLKIIEQEVTEIARCAAPLPNRPYRALVALPGKARIDGFREY